MKRRALTVVMAAVIAWTVVASSLPAAQGAAGDWSRPKSIESGGIRVYYPRSWHASVNQSMISIRSGATRIMLIDYGTIEAGYFPQNEEGAWEKHEYVYAIGEK